MPWSAWRKVTPTRREAAHERRPRHGRQHGMGPFNTRRTSRFPRSRGKGACYAMTRAIGAWRRMGRSTPTARIERMPPADYSAHELLRDAGSTGSSERLVRDGLGHARRSSQRGTRGAGRHRSTPALHARAAPHRGLNRGLASSDDTDGAGRASRSAHRVRARNMHPTGTRDCRATRAEGRHDRDAITACTFSLTPALHGQARIGNMSTPCASRPRELWGEQRLGARFRPSRSVGRLP